MTAHSGRAADLPDGSVVADSETAYIKTHPSRTAQWRGTRGGYHANWEIDQVLAQPDSQILRVGDGR